MPPAVAATLSEQRLSPAELPATTDDAAKVFNSDVQITLQAETRVAVSYGLQGIYDAGE